MVLNVFRSTLIAHKTARKPYFMGLVVLKEIIFRKREYQEYITPQNFGSGVFLFELWYYYKIMIRKII